MPVVLRLVRSGIFWATLGGALLTTLAVTWLVSNDGQEIPATINRRVDRLPAAASQKRRRVLKPVMQANDYEDLFVVKEQIDERVEQFATRLIESLGPYDAAHVTTLRQVYSTGQFLRELSKWLDTPTSRNAATSRDRAELLQIVEQWNDWERLVAGLAKGSE